MNRVVLTTVSVSLIGILIVVAGFFLLDIEKIALNFWAFGSLLFSLVVSLLATVTLVAPQSKKDNVFYVAGLSSAIGIYILSVVVSILFTNSFVDRLHSFIFLQIAINAVFFIVAIVIMSVSEQIYDSNARTYDNLQKEEYNKPKRGGF